MRGGGLCKYVCYERMCSSERATYRDHDVVLPV